MMALWVYLLVASAMCFSSAAVILADDHRTKVQWGWLVPLSLVWPATLTTLVVLVLIVAIKEGLGK